MGQCRGDPKYHGDDAMKADAAASDGDAIQGFGGLAFGPVDGVWAEAGAGRENSTFPMSSS
jgi:hypothetical protein